ncbi:MAG: aminoacyl-tRNA hydrolase [Chloroflexi bacterium]|nr:aminoacyl-tRNA hydrolase [Chloroflexota bacterium]
MIKDLLASLRLPRRPPKTEPDRIERLLVFLGNPGPQYERTRHNLGFMTGERLLAQQAGARLRQAFKGRFWQGRIDARNVGVLLPETFMNASGESVERAARRGRVEVSDIVVVYDDMDLEFGLLRIRSGGSSGGHLGVKSIIEELNSPDFVRLRMGIGRPPERVTPVDFLLDDFSRSEIPRVEEMIDDAAAAIVQLLNHPLEIVMNEFNQRSSRR